MDLSLPSQWIIEAEPWQWFAVGTPGILAAWWLYGRRGGGVEKKSTGGGLSVTGRLGLALIRWCAITILTFLLLEPLIREIELEKEEPIAVVLVDQSASILARIDSVSGAQALNDWFKELGQELEELGLGTEWYGFDRSLFELASEDPPTFRWKGAQTNLSEAIQELNDRIENRNIAGIILASDGLVNRGADPEYGTSWPLAPTFTVGLGDTTRHEDRWIVRVNHNQIAYLNNTFPVEAIVQSQGMEGQNARVRIFKGGKQLAQEEWVCASNQDLKKVKFMLPAMSAGTQKYRIEASAGGNEFDLENNNRNFYVEVLESRRVVTCIASAPHPDLGAIAMALNELDAYEVNTIYLSNPLQASGILEALKESDVIVAHNLLGQTWEGKDWETWIASTNVNTWWMAASSASFNCLRNPNGLGVRLTSTSDLTQNFRGRMNPSYGIIDFNVNELGEEMRSWPPMTGPMESVAWSQSWTPLLFKQLGNLETQDAFWATEINPAGIRTALTLGEGLWNWRMRNYLQENDHGSFDQLIQRHVQFLAASNERERFRIQTESRVSNDVRVSFQAEAYDAGWTMSENAEIEVILRDESGSEFFKTMRFDGDRYLMDFGRMPEGQYTWDARCTIAQEMFTEKGIIVVENTFIEQTSLPADHGILERIASQNGGEYIGIWQSKKPSEAALAFVKSGIPATVLHEQVALQNGVEWIPLLLIALLLLAAEWIIRRRTVGY